MNIEPLIKKVRLYEFMYNEHSPGYRDQNMRLKPWEEIGFQFFNQDSGSKVITQTQSDIRLKNLDKRLRTPYSEQQLHALRVCYAMNPKITAVMKQHLSDVTGLSNRKIVVWFQNRRMKDKKIAIKRKKEIEQGQITNNTVVNATVWPSDGPYAFYK